MDPTGLDQRYVVPEDVQHRLVGKRNAQAYLPFLLPHVRPGLDVLDAGCGVGSIALDVATKVAPGRVVGIDFDPGQIEAARQSAAEIKLENAEFFTASVYQLPFDVASFDVVYSNAVLMYVREPVRALAEMRRVLRPGGLAAVIDDDYGTIVMSPDRPELQRGGRLLERLITHAGGNARYSRHLRSLMLEAGFARTQGVAHASSVYGDAAGTRWLAEIATGQLGAPSVSELIVGEGWASREELNAAIAALREWGERPDAFAAWLWCGALGWTT